MRPYLNRKGDSGIAGFEIGDDFIRIQFLNGSPYLYTYTSAGRDNVEEMKRLALAGEGLATFISQHPSVRKGYVK